MTEGVKAWNTWKNVLNRILPIVSFRKRHILWYLFTIDISKQRGGGGVEEQLYRNEKFLSKFLPKETSSGQCKTGCIAKQTRPFVNTARFEIELLALTWNRSYTLLRETTSKIVEKEKHNEKTLNGKLLCCTFMLYVLYETFWNFINTVIRHDSQDFIGKIWNQSESIFSYYRFPIYGNEQTCPCFTSSTDPNQEKS